MPFTSYHPQYVEAHKDWVIMRDTYAGERRVKSKGFTYLPATPGQVADGAADSVNSDGYKNYLAYQTRARFYGFVLDAVRSMCGFLHSKPATFELPEKMKPLLKRASSSGESLEQLLQRIHLNQVLTGRIGLLGDIDTVTSTPFIATYDAECILNWDTSADYDGRDFLNLVILDETTFVRNADFSWDSKEKYRVLELIGKSYVTQEVEHVGEYDPATALRPSYVGRFPDEIPFVFINCVDQAVDIGFTPLLDLANLSLSIYRSDADYRHHLFMQSQDTLVVIGSANKDETIRVGAGARIDVDIQGDAKFIGVNSQGLAEQRAALDNDKKIATARSIQLVQPSAANRESGSSLQRRVSAQTISLKDIAIAGANGLESVLKKLAVWMGENPDDVKVTPNLDFADSPIEGAELLSFMQAKQAGAPFSLKSMHEYLKRRGFTTMEYEDEIKEIENEPELVIQPSSTSGSRNVSGKNGNVPANKAA